MYRPPVLPNRPFEELLLEVPAYPPLRHALGQPNALSRTRGIEEGGPFPGSAPISTLSPVRGPFQTFILFLPAKIDEPSFPPPPRSGVPDIFLHFPSETFPRDIFVVFDRFPIPAMSPPTGHPRLIFFFGILMLSWTARFDQVGAD